MKNNIKAIFLALIASVCMVPTVFADEGDTQKEEPSIFLRGGDTVLIPGGLSISEYLYLYSDEEKVKHDKDEMAKILIFEYHGGEKKGRLEMIGTFKDLEEGRLKKDEQAEKWIGYMNNNMAIKCPNNGQGLLAVVLGENVALPACSVCNEINRNFGVYSDLHATEK